MPPYNEMKDLIEVKTTSNNNYKIGKTTINQMIGEDYEPDKPIMNYNHLPTPHNIRNNGNKT